MPANHRDFLDSLENEQSAPCNALHIFTKDKPGCIQALRSSRYEIQWAAVGPQNFSLCFAEPRYEPTVSAEWRHESVAFDADWETEPALQGFRPCDSSAEVEGIAALEDAFNNCIEALLR